MHTAEGSLKGEPPGLERGLRGEAPPRHQQRVSAVLKHFHTHYLICSAQLPGEEERLGIVMFHWMHQEAGGAGQASQRARSRGERQSGQPEESPPLPVTVRDLLEAEEGEEA